MFANLIESSPAHSKSSGQVFLSLAFHVAIGAGAIGASRHVIVANPVPKVDTTAVYIVRPTPAVEAPPDPGAVAAGPVGPANPILVGPPVDVPVGIPPIEAGPAIDPRRFVFEPTRPGCSDCGAGRDSTGGLFVEAAVDEPARVVSQPAPVFPAVLKTAGVSGRVVVQFVVDTTGAVEPGSIGLAESSHPAFEASAKVAIAATRFAPARIRGQAVRQVVRQAVRFEIRP